MGRRVEVGEGGWERGEVFCLDLGLEARTEPPIELGEVLLGERRTGGGGRSVALGLVRLL